MKNIFKKDFFSLKVFRSGAIALSVGSLMGCSLWTGGTEQYKPVNLGENIPVMGIRQAWMVQLGSELDEKLIPHVRNTTITFASANGVVVAIDALTGRDVWRSNIGENLVAGVGSDGLRTAVVSRGNELIVMERGREQWRQRLTAQVYTSPFVAGGRVFILSADHTITAFDVTDGRRLWVQSRSGEGLVLRQPGVLMAVGKTLLAGFSGHLVGLNPDTGAEQWQASVAIPRGTNDLERLVELVSPVSRTGENVCVRAFQAAIGCVDTNLGTVNWTRKTTGTKGLDGDEKAVYETENNGSIAAWSRSDASQLWLSDRLKYRKLTAPVVWGFSVVVGDEAGLVHFFSRNDGSPLNRLSTDGSGISMLSATAADILVVSTRKGSIYGFRPS